MENKRKLAGNIVRARYVLMMVLLLAAGFSAAMIGRTNINYDLTRYLADDTMTKRALVVMNEEFGVSEQLRVMFADLSEAQLREALETLDEMEEIRLASHDPVSDVRVKDGKTWQLVTLTLGECNVSRLVRKLRGLFPDFGEYMVGGSAAAQIDLQESVAVEIPAVMAIAVAIVILVLLLTSHAWLEPVVILFVLAVSIVINMGTNFVFPDVSFVTFAVSAILQLALSIDYAIMLLHTYNAFCDQGMGPEEAMTEALAQCFMRIASSAMTTVAGLLSLLFMSFTIGFDIGMVLSKGIVISMLCVFLLMPGAALLLKKPLMATRHRPIRLGGEHLGRWIWRMRWPIAIVLTAAVAGGAYLNARNTFSFTDPGATDGTENSRISEVFGASNPLVLMVPSEGKDSDYDRQRALVSDLEALKGADGAPLVSGIASMVTTGAAALEYYTVDDVAQMTGQSRLRITLFFFLNGFGQRARADRLLAVAGGLFGDNPDLAGMKALLETAQGAFTGPHYARLLVEPAFESRAEDFTDNIEAVLSAVRASYGDTFYVTGSPMSAYDVGEAFNSDLMKVNLITLAAILLIVILSFRAVGLPLLLVLVIEGAIWITMGISTLIGESIFFISYLICLSIQMGATIDYGILLSDQYRTLRREGLAPREALTEALKKALPTILTSGIILISAGFVIGRYCTIYYISSIGLLVSRGALVSVVLVLTLLPALLSLADRWIIRVNVPPDPGTDGPRT